MSPRRAPVRRSRWPYISLIPIGLGAWAPIYAGVRARVLAWVLLGVLWCLCVVAGFVQNASGGHAGSDDLAGALFIVGWVGAVATSFTIRSSYDRRMGGTLAAAAATSEERLRDRADALRIAREHPALAKEMGIGRPELPGSAAGGVVDVNNAAVTALLGLPHIDGPLAAQIVDAREKVNGFSSLEDMGTTMDLGGDVVESLRDRVVFLPR